MKVVQLSQLKKDSDRQNALNEVRLLSSLDLKNVIKLYSTFLIDENDTLCLVMESAELGDLKQSIESVIEASHKDKTRHFIPEENIWKVLLHSLRGLHELHIRGIVHRDIKSANLFIFPDNLIKLGDFNVSMIVNEGIKMLHYYSPQ
jgi:NIMA (never in mitosis gene a)-related kinase 1/4/5